MLSKVFLMSNRLVTFAEGVTNAEQVVTHEQLIIIFARASTLLGKVTDQLLTSNNLLSICNKSVLQEESSLLAKVTDQLLKSNSFSKSN